MSEFSCSSSEGYSDNNFPLLTIGIPTFDRKELLLETINSILSQSCYEEGLDCEIIVANDNPQRIVDEKFLGIKNNERIRYLNNKVNLGEWENFNKILRNSHGRYITIIGDDDLLSPIFLELIYKLIRTYNFPDCVSTSFTQDYNTFRKNMTKKIMNDDIVFSNGRDFLEDYLFNKIEILGNGICFRKDKLKSIGGYGRWATFGYADTYLVFKALLCCGNMAYLNIPLIYYRDHSGSLSSYVVDNYDWALSQEEFFNKVDNLFLLQIPLQYNKYMLKIYGFWILSSMRSRMRRRGTESLLPVLHIYCGFIKKIRGSVLHKIAYYLSLVFFLLKVIISEVARKTNVLRGW